MPFQFKPRLLDQRPGSKNDREPRWAKIPTLGQVIERAGRAVFVANAAHPALRTFGKRDLGPADNADDAMMANVAGVFRLCQQIKRQWKRGKRTENEARLATLDERVAERRKAA